MPTLSLRHAVVASSPRILRHSRSGRILEAEQEIRKYVFFVELSINVHAVMSRKLHP